MQTTTQKRRLKRRYRKMAAAVAGAAVMSTALLHGFPVAKVLAAPNPAVESTADTTAADAPDSTAAAPDKSPGDATPARDRGHDRDRDNDRWEARSPVQVVMDNAATFGFDVSRDSFSLLTKTARRATVQVRHDGQTFKVDLERSGDSWVIRTIRGIGDMRHPASYTPASFFPGAALTTPVPPAGQTTLFQTDAFKAWNWREAVYPSDMSFGIALQDPRPAGVDTTVPDNVLNNVDFGRQLLLFAHVGSVAPQGYGVGIAKVVRSGNDLTVTVRTKSPQTGDAAATKTDDYLAVDRANLDFRSPVRIAFVDQYGTVLVTYTVVPQ